MKLKSILLLSAASLMYSSTFAQSAVSTGGVKYSLLEEGTGTWCGYCPDGAQRIQQTIEPGNPHCISVAWHNADPMALTPDDFNTTYIASPAGPGWPGGTVDRTVFTHDYGTSGGGVKTRVGHNRGFWNTDVTAQCATTPKFDVKMICTYDSSTTGATARLLTIKVTAKTLVAGTGSWRINALITEDSISSAAPNDQHSYMYSTSSSWFFNQCLSACPGYACSSCAVLPPAIYSHMGVVKSVLATAGTMWGDAAFTNPAVGDSFTKTYTYTIPATSVAKFTKVVGMVQKFGTTTTDRAIENVIEAKVKGMWKVYPTPSGVNQVAGVLENIELAPNPAANYVTISGTISAATNTKITITNATGQLVAEKEIAAGANSLSEKISLSNISNGIYFMNIINNGANVTKQFVISK